MNFDVTPLVFNIQIVDTRNPYLSTATDSALEKPLTLRSRDGRKGPAMLIAIGAFLGGIAGAPLLMNENILGFFGVLPGSLLAGIAYRLRSANWPVDPTACYRRYRYATLAVVPVPLLTAMVTGMRAQGLGITILAFVIGMSVALGILVSGDRRSGTVE
jgi:hypothetical protein